MSLPLSQDLVRLLGPCRILHAWAPDTALVAELLLSGCDAWAWRGPGAGPDAEPPDGHPRWLSAMSCRKAAFDVVLVESGGVGEPLPDLSALFARVEEPPVLAIKAPGANRPVIEGPLFDAGWRRHPAGMTLDQYGRMSDQAMAGLAVYERVPPSARAAWSVADLQADRPLHMDMLREGGPRADAHVARYALAATYVRKGDLVLDCACGPGYGAAVMASLAPGGQVIGIDGDPGAIAYARANYDGPGLSYRVGDAALLDDIPDASVDLIVSMETIEHVKDWLATVRTFRRVLKPDGRLIASVPDRWVDETETDPNPHHFHAFDWDTFSGALGDLFILEKRYTQTAPGGVKLQRAPRRLHEVPLNADVTAEWLIAVAAVNPLEDGAGFRAAYRHPAFDDALTARRMPAVDFAGGYDNPYLYRPLVQVGERLRDRDLLVRFASLTATVARDGSPDKGAALCVLGYRVLEQRNEHAAADVLEMIAAHMEAASAEGEAGTEAENPHGLRWRLSLAFLAGRLSSLRGDRRSAVTWFETAAALDWRVFSPLIATKVVAAHYHRAALLLADDDRDGARAAFEQGLACCLEVLRRDPLEVVGDPAHPVPFGLPELAEIADMGGQCAMAIASLPLLERDRGLFWRQIDVKRFGLMTWAQDMERACDHLKQRSARTLRIAAE